MNLIASTIVSASISTSASTNSRVNSNHGKIEKFRKPDFPAELCRGTGFLIAIDRYF